MEWMLMPLRRYAEFSGRSRRKEYWMFVLFTLILGVVAGVIDGVLGMNAMIAGIYGPVTALVGLATLVPSIAVGVRRLHDTDRSGLWVLLPLGLYCVVFIGLALQNTLLTTVGGVAALAAAVTLLVFFVLAGTPGPNRFGPDPKGQADPAVFA